MCHSRYEGNAGELGEMNSRPKFTSQAPVSCNISKNRIQRNREWLDKCGTACLQCHPYRCISAQALLGFDESIDMFCTDEHRFFDTELYMKNHAGNCVNSNNNILSMYGNRMPYNICRNLEWQVQT